MQKPGWQTTEFWITLVVILLGALMSSGLICNAGESWQLAIVCKAIGALIALAAKLGYTASRTYLKANQ